MHNAFLVSILALALPLAGTGGPALGDTGAPELGSPALGGAALPALRGTASPTPAGPSHARIKALMASMEKAARVHDADGFLKPFLHDSSLVFVINGEVIHGWDALHAAQLKWWNNGRSDAVYTQVGETQFTDVAPGVVLTTQRLASKRTGPDGKPATGTFAVTNVWHNGPDGWQIMYAHESWAR